MLSQFSSETKYWNSGTQIFETTRQDDPERLAGPNGASGQENKYQFRLEISEIAIKPPTTQV